MKSLRHMGIAGVVILLAGCGAGEEIPGPEQIAEEQARSAVRSLKQNLLAELTAAVAAEGPSGAIGICRVRARMIPVELRENGVEIGRTSHRLRNPDNAPQHWMLPILADYEATPQNRMPRSVRIDDATMGVTEPIIVQELCLNCHGWELEDGVRETLAELYPDDRATGFEVGEFRGMFWATAPIVEPAS